MVPDVNSASTHAVQGVARQVRPEQAWVLAPLIAGQRTYRTGRWIGTRFQYPRPKTLPRITAALPTRPAAVMVHGTDGSVSTLCLDLDTSKAHKAVLEEDAAHIRRLLSGSGLRWVEDFSPSGGRHVYIPLQERMRASEARELVEALALTAPSLDPSPHQNITDGCIRVPGSIHKSGGHQILVNPLNEAYDILRRRNAPDAVAKLQATLVPELRRQKKLKARAAKAMAGGLPSSPAPTSRAGAESPLRRVARTGLYDTARYKSPSEARMAVLTHFAACRWTVDQVQVGIAGQFPGLAALYGTEAKQVRLLETEWAKAVAWTQKDSLPAQGNNYALINNTSPTKPTGGASDPTSTAGIHQLVNDVENILYAVLDHRLKERGREGISLRLLFRSLLGYMRAKGTDVLDVGCRTLATAMGRHHVTIARLLPRLVEVSEGIVSKVADARRRFADVYLIQIPVQHQKLARELSWRKGKIYGVRPVFRALGDPSALVYETIERGRHSPTSAQIIRITGISRTAVENALSEMTTLGMIHRHNGLWRVTSTANLRQLAVRLGVMDDVQEQIRQHRMQRAAWHAYLDRFKDQGITAAEMYDEEKEAHWLPPDDDRNILWAVA